MGPLQLCAAPSSMLLVPHQHPLQNRQTNLLRCLEIDHRLKLHWLLRLAHPIGFSTWNHWLLPVMFMEVGTLPGLRFARSRLFSSNLVQPPGPPAHRDIEWRYRKC